MASSVLQAACYFHQYYGLCQCRCKKKKFCLMSSNAVAPITPGTVAHQPSFYRIGEERRRTRREHEPRRWMMPPLSFRMIG